MIEKKISYRICIPLWDAIQLETISIEACLKVAINNMYKIPNICIAHTPREDRSTILKKSVLTLSKVPEKKMAGINAKM